MFWCSFICIFFFIQVVSWPSYFLSTYFSLLMSICHRGFRKCHYSTFNHSSELWQCRDNKLRSLNRTNRYAKKLQIDIEFERQLYWTLWYSFIYYCRTSIPFILWVFHATASFASSDTFKCHKHTQTHGNMKPCIACIHKKDFHCKSLHAETCSCTYVAQIPAPAFVALPPSVSGSGSATYI